jgi:hypothetical protein
LMPSLDLALQRAIRRRPLPIEESNLAGSQNQALN